VHSASQQVASLEHADQHPLAWPCSAHSGAREFRGDGLRLSFSTPAGPRACTHRACSVLRVSPGRRGLRGSQWRLTCPMTCAAQKSPTHWRAALGPILYQSTVVPLYGRCVHNAGQIPHVRTDAPVTLAYHASSDRGPPSNSQEQQAFPVSTRSAATKRTPLVNRRVHREYRALAPHIHVSAQSWPVAESSRRFSRSRLRVLPRPSAFR